MFFLIAACVSASGPETLGQSMDVGTLFVAPGDREVELIRWFLPEQGTTTGITFSLLVPDADGMGGTRWVPDPATWTEHPTGLPPVPTVVQRAIELCWLEDEHGRAVDYVSSSIPDGQGDIVFRRLWKQGGTVALVCDITPSAVSGLTVGVGFEELTNQERNSAGDGYAWRGTYDNGFEWTEPTRLVVIRPE